jgi:RNA polymerase sigma factor (sigma-70 family)
MQIEDKDILELFENPETKEKGFALLVKKYSKPTYWHIRKILLHHEDTNDVLQNVFIKIWENLHNFRKESKLYTWIFRIAYNETISFINHSKSKYISSIDDEQQHIQIEALEADTYYKPNEIEKKLQQGISKLPKQQRTIFLLRYYNDLSYKEIAKITNMNISTLKATYHIAAKKIEAYLKSS